MTKENPKSNLFVISDLHLSAGFNEETKCYSREEDFFFDNEFRRFLEHMEKESPGSNHLIINGDMFDFLQVNGDYAKKLEEQGKVQLVKDENYYGLGTEPDKTVLKLQRIRDGHRIFFESLSKFLSKGNELSIISGNHDIELFWDRVREELINTLSNNDNSIKNRIKFHLWFYYDKDNNIYIEHGNQYDRLNSFKVILNPIMPEQRKKILLPFGSFFVRYFLNKVEDFNPFADNIKPTSRYIQWAFKNHRLRSLCLLRRYIPTLFKTFWRSKGLSKINEEKLLEEARPRFEAIAIETGLPLNIIMELHGKLKPPISRWKLLLLLVSAWILVAVLFTLLILVSFVIVFILKYYFEYSISYWSLIFSLLPFLLPIINWLISRSEKDEIGSLLNEIKEGILKDAKIIVMGHTHDPAIKKIGNDCWYYNTSTWTTVFSEEERLIRDEKQFALLKVKLTDKGPDAQLMRWNDAAGECEQLILFEENKK